MKHRMRRTGTITTDWVANRMDTHIAILQPEREHLIMKERYIFACILLGIHQEGETMLQMLDIGDGMIDMCENHPGAAGQ